MSTLEQKIENLTIKDQQATLKVCELRDLLIEIKRDIEIIREYQRHLNSHLNSSGQVKPNTKQ